MYDSPNYPTHEADVDRFVRQQRHGTLIATPPDGHPQVTMLPFVLLDNVIEVHCVAADPTLRAVLDNPNVTFVVSDFLAVTPHDWVESENAARGTLHFRLATFEGIASVSQDPDDVAAALRRLLRWYEPNSQYHPIDNNELYGPRLRRLAAVRIEVKKRRAKFKLGPHGPDALKWRVVALLRERGLPGDARAADIIASYLPTDPPKGKPPL